MSLRMERYCEKYAMGLVDNEDDVTIEKLLHGGRGEVTLIEGDPGSGKTTLTLHICKKWAEGELLTKEFLIWVPLRCHELATNTNDLFELFERLGCPVPGMKEYAQQNNGEGLVLILDGWDELPNQLQAKSLFSDIVFSRNSMFFYSTIIVTSRPSCSESIAEVVQQRKAHYQILGFSPHNSELYIIHYFNNDLQSAELLIALLKGREYLRRHFYIPITVAIMCFVYSHCDDGEIPETLSKLYEHFVTLYVCSNVPDTCRKDIKGFNTLSNVPKILEPLFGKLCKTAYEMLRDKKLVFDEDTLGITDSDLRSLHLDPEQFDGLGLLHVEYFPTKWATTKRSYSFIHRAVQELLAAISILDNGSISDILDEHFCEDSYLINMFPFLFGLVPKEYLTPLAGKLIQIFTKSDKKGTFLPSILYCLFEAHDETLCREFAEVFIKEGITLYIDTLLDCHYASYFIAVCGVQHLMVQLCFTFGGLCDLCTDIMYKYLQNTPTDIAAFDCIFYEGKLSLYGISQFAKTLSTQCNIVSVTMDANCDPGSITIFCSSLSKYNPFVYSLVLPYSKLSENDLEIIGYLLTTAVFLKILTVNGSPNEGVCLDLSHSLYTALCDAKSLQNLRLPNWSLSQADSKVFGNIISQNCSLKVLYITVATADCLNPIMIGLSSSTSITTFKAWPSKTDTSNRLGQCLERCLTFNHSLNIVDFTPCYITFTSPCYISWSSTQMSSICTGLCANTTVVTLDISGCYIDTEASNAVCGMLSQNTTLQHLFLNPIHLEKQEAITMINRCSANATLELLSLVQWHPKRYRWSDVDEGKDTFQYSSDPELNYVLLKIQNLRQEKNEPLLKVYWLVAINIVLMLSNVLCIGNMMSIEK